MENWKFKYALKKLIRPRSYLYTRLPAQSGVAHGTIPYPELPNGIASRACPFGKKEDGIAKENIPEGICTKTLCSGYEKSKKPSGEKLKNSADKHHRIKPRLYKNFHAHTK